MRNLILEQWDRMASQPAAPAQGGGHLELLAEIRDSLRRIEAGIAAGAQRPD